MTTTTISDLVHQNVTVLSSSLMVIIPNSTSSPLSPESNLAWLNRSFESPYLFPPLDPTTSSTPRAHSSPTNLIGSIIPWIRTLNYLIVICSAIGICALCFCLLSIILFAFHRLWYGAGGLYNDDQLGHVDTLTTQDKNQPSLQYFASLTNAPESFATSSSTVSTVSSGTGQHNPGQQGPYQYGFPKLALRNYWSQPLGCQSHKPLLCRSHTTASATTTLPRRTSHNNHNNSSGVYQFSSSQFFPKMDLANHYRINSDNKKQTQYKSSNCVISLEDDLHHSSQVDSARYNLHYRNMTLGSRQPPSQPPPPPPTLLPSSVPTSSLSWLVHPSSATASQQSLLPTEPRHPSHLSTFYTPAHHHHHHLYQSIPDIKSSVAQRPTMSSDFYPIPAERKSIKGHSSSGSKSLLILPVKLLKQQHRSLRPITKYRISHNYMNPSLHDGHHYRNQSQIQLHLQEQAQSQIGQLASPEQNKYLSTYSEVISELKNRFVIREIQY